MAAVNDGCVIAARAAKFWIFIGGNKPAAATAADSAVCAFSPGRKTEKVNNVIFFLIAVKSLGQYYPQPHGTFYALNLF